MEGSSSDIMKEATRRFPGKMPSRSRYEMVSLLDESTAELEVKIRNFLPIRFPGTPYRWAVRGSEKRGNKKARLTLLKSIVKKRHRSDMFEGRYVLDYLSELVKEGESMQFRDAKFDLDR